MRAIRRSPVPLCISRVPGVLQAEQTESGQTVGNDRILAVCAKDKATPQTLADVDNDFLSGGAGASLCHHAEGNRFRVIKIGGTQDTFGLLRNTAMDSSRWGPPPAIGFQGVPLPRLVKRTGPPISVWFKPRRYPRRFRRPDARVLAAFRAAWLRSFRVLPFAAARPWRESAASDADSFPSRFSAALTARDRFGDGLVFPSCLLGVLLRLAAGFSGSRRSFGRLQLYARAARL